MIGLGQALPAFRVTGVRPGFNAPVEDGVSAFDTLTETSFPGRWKVIVFYPKDFTFVCPTELKAFADLVEDFDLREATILAGSTDNEFVKLAWRRDHENLDRLPYWQFSDPSGRLANALGVLDSAEQVAQRVTLLVDPHNVVQHIYATALNVGRAPEDTLRVLDALQTDELCACNRPVGGTVIRLPGLQTPREGASVGTDTRAKVRSTRSDRRR